MGKIFSACAHLSAICFLAIIPAAAAELETLYKFNSGMSQNPTGGIIQGSDNRFYGATFGAPRTLFAVNVTGSAFTTLHTFGGTDYTFGRLMQGSDQKLYGALNDAGYGRFFRIDPNGSNYEDIKTFVMADLGTGTTPTAAPLEASDGKLYGMLTFGGTSGFGAIYRMDKDGGNFSVIFAFTGTTIPFYGAANNGEVGSLFQASNGFIYGTTRGGGLNARGVIFRIQLVPSTYQAIHHFAAGEGGVGYKSGLCEASDGRLYGVTRLGGNTNSGTLYGIDPDGGNFSVLHHFLDPSGRNPTAELVEGDDGRLYGTCPSGGGQNGPTPHTGVVFRIQKDGTGYSVVNRFGTPNSPGGSPAGSLIPQGPGNYLGIAREGQYDGIFYRLIAPQKPPTITGKKRVRSRRGRRKVTLRGRAADDIAVANVFCRIPGKGFRRAKGSRRWRIRVPVRKRRTVVPAFSIDFDENRSGRRRFVILRK